MKRLSSAARHIHGFGENSRTAHVFALGTNIITLHSAIDVGVTPRHRTVGSACRVILLREGLRVVGDAPLNSKKLNIAQARPNSKISPEI